HAGVTIVDTSCQSRGSVGRSGSNTGFWPHEFSSPTFPAAATITTSLSTAAYRTAAPSAACSIGAAALMHAVTEMFITRTPRFAKCTIARASVAMSPAFSRISPSSPAAGFAGPNAADDCRTDISVTSGATPTTPSGWPGGGPGTGGSPPSSGPAAGADWSSGLTAGAD